MRKKGKGDVPKIVTSRAWCLKDRQTKWREISRRQKVFHVMLTWRLLKFRLPRQDTFGFHENIRILRGATDKNQKSSLRSESGKEGVALDDDDDAVSSEKPASISNLDSPCPGLKRKQRAHQKKNNTWSHLRTRL